MLDPVRPRPHASRRADDYYATPAWCTHALLDVLPPVRGVTVLDPCAGDGAILRVCAARGARVAGIELNPTRAALAGALCADALASAARPHSRWPMAEWIITNPPYRDAERFARHALNHAPRVALLLRLGFLASAARAAFWHAHPGAHVAVLSRRPSFTGDGRTDGSEYAWFVWGAPGLAPGGWSRLERGAS